MIRRAAAFSGLSLLFAAASASAQPVRSNEGPPAPAPVMPVAPIGATDPVVISVDGRPVRLSEVGRIVQTLPPALRSVPYEKLFPEIIERLADHLALVMMAKRAGLESKPDIQRDITAATDRILESAYLAQKAVPLVTEDAIRRRYDQLYARRPSVEEVRARHILVGTEAEARTVIDEVRKGADFATLARSTSRDSDAEKGGDLGFLRRAEMSPNLADVAFGLAPGEVAPDPVRNEFGWHVVKVEEKRTVPPPSFNEVRQQIRQDLLADAVRQVIQDARGQVIVHHYNVDGTEMSSSRAADAAAAALLPR
ncbi:MAG: peptidylprolyl isomerase [Acetobacteraceae bacterium]|nr:peptidylprolyl isomerase [Pseudomonadota bacterium]